ncbi:MAG: hypothetical protein M0R02_05870 [Bacteroidales bacterium]|nr:hypothetical protein [Bacteroidales bacterium]NLK82089.1 hypothetical protein [Bacteroidales bacterium]HPY81851.1 hypothetical protein [Bacteroidales bacterium]
MNREHLIKYIQNPNLIDDEATRKLEQMLQQYPYFQTAHLLFVKGLKNSNDSRFQNQLKIAATHAGNRTLLFNVLHEQHAEFVYAPENQTEHENIIPETVPVLPETVDSETPITDAQFAQELEEVQEPETQGLDSVVEIPADSVLEEQKGEITEDETVTEDVVIPIESSEIPEPLELDAQTSPPESPSLEDISIPEPPSIVVAETDVSTELPQEPKHIHSDTVQTEKTEQSLADIVLQRLKEIEERDKQAQADQIAEPEPEPLHEDTPVVADVPTEPQLSESEMSDEDTISHTIPEQSQEPHIQKSKDDKLLNFVFSDFEEKTENETVSPPQSDNKTVVHASSMWFENSEIPPESLDISNPIDAFLAKQPQMKPRFEITESTEEQHDISEESVREGEYLSETLAKVYVAQKNYTKAIHIYQKLSLKYPQKSVYFANQILEIQQKLK